MATNDVQAALRKALAGYLSTQLAAALPDAPPVVSENWPTGPNLPPLAVTVLAPAEPEVSYHAPVIRSVTPTSDIAGTCLYTYGYAVFPVQLDCWAQFEAVRDLLSAAVRDALLTSIATTMGSPTLPELQRNTRLILPVPDYFNAACAYDFAAGPRPTEDTNAQQLGEWRAMWQGQACIYLHAQQSVALMNDIAAQISANGGASTSFTV